MMDVFSLGATVAEIMSESRERLRNVLPTNLSRHYVSLHDNPSSHHASVASKQNWQLNTGSVMATTPDKGSCLKS